MTEPSRTDDRDPLLDEAPFASLRASLLAAAERHQAADQPSGPPPAEARPAVVELEAARARRARRRVLGLLSGAAAVVIAVALTWTLVGGNGGESAAAGVVVSRDGDRVRVVLEDTITTRDVHDALEAQGIDATIEGQTTGPSKRNRFLGAIGPAADLPNADDAGTSDVATFAVGAEVRLIVGVAASPGSAYDTATDATGPGEPLAGAKIVGKDISAARSVLDALPDDIRVEYRSSTGPPLDGTPDRGKVTMVQALAADRVVVFVEAP